MMRGREEAMQMIEEAAVVVTTETRICQKDPLHDLGVMMTDGGQIMTEAAIDHMTDPVIGPVVATMNSITMSSSCWLSSNISSIELTTLHSMGLIHINTISTVATWIPTTKATLKKLASMLLHRVCHMIRDITDRTHSVTDHQIAAVSAPLHEAHLQLTLMNFRQLTSLPVH